jgi:hypothetical protein
MRAPLSDRMHRIDNNVNWNCSLCSDLQTLTREEMLSRSSSSSIAFTVDSKKKGTQLSMKGMKYFPFELYVQQKVQTFELLEENFQTLPLFCQII